jgi:pimeloyl-ACP methyl ester carboxylesterase
MIHYEMIADDVVRAIEQLGLDPAHIAGLSDGGTVALVIGMTRPDVARAFVAIGLNYYNDDLVVIANQFADLEIMTRERPEEMAGPVAMTCGGASTRWSICIRRSPIPSCCWSTTRRTRCSSRIPGALGHKCSIS